MQTPRLLHSARRRRRPSPTAVPRAASPCPSRTCQVRCAAACCQLPAVCGRPPSIHGHPARAAPWSLLQPAWWCCPTLRRPEARPSILRSPGWTWAAARGPNGRATTVTSCPVGCPCTAAARGGGTGREPAGRRSTLWRTPACWLPTSLLCCPSSTPLLADGEMDAGMQAFAHFSLHYLRPRLGGGAMVLDAQVRAACPGGNNGRARLLLLGPCSSTRGGRPTPPSCLPSAPSSCRASSASMLGARCTR